MLFNCIFKSQCFTSMAWQRGFPTSLPPTPPKSKGQLSMGHFFQVENRLLPFLWGVNPDQFLSPKFGAKLLTKYCRINKKKHSFTGTKAQEASSIFFCVCVCVFGAKMRYVDEEPTLPIWIVLKFRTFLQPKLIFLSISILCEVSKKSEIFVETIRYGLKWGH